MKRGAIFKWCDICLVFANSILHIHTHPTLSTQNQTLGEADLDMKRIIL